MAIPATAVRWTQSMDPSDLVDYEIDLSGVSSILEDGELIDFYTLTVGAEGVAVGFTIGDVAPYEPVLSGGTNITMWFSVDEADRNNPAFVAGVDVPIELEIITDSSPSRRKQRTFVVTVVQK